MRGRAALSVKKRMCSILALALTAGDVETPPNGIKGGKKPERGCKGEKEIF